MYVYLIKITKIANNKKKMYTELKIYMQKSCESLREHTTKITNFEKKKIIPIKTNSRNRIKMQKSAT